MLETSQFTKFLLDSGAAITTTLSSTHYQRSPPVKGVLEIPCVVNGKLIGAKKNTEILAKYLETIQNHYPEPSSDEDVMGSFLAISFMKMETLQTVQTAQNVPIKGKKTNHWKMWQCLTPNLVVISELFKRTWYQIKQVAPETKGNVPSDAIKSDLNAID